MAKKPGRNSQPAPISTTQPNSTSIDDIFASGSSSKPLKPLAHPSSSTSASKHKVDARLPEATQDKTDKKKKRPKSVPTFNPDLASTANPGVPSITKTKAEPQSKSKPKSKPTVVETIYDPSAQTRSVPVRPVKDVKGTKRSRLAVEEDEAFRDSRGDGPRRKTEEGFYIFKEAELRIDPEAGGGLSFWVGDADMAFEKRIRSRG